MLGNQVLKGRLRIIIGESVIDINEFEPIFKTGMLVLASDSYTVKGKSLIDKEVVNEPIEEKVEEPEGTRSGGSIITNEDILKTIKKEDNE